MVGSTVGNTRGALPPARRRVIRPSLASVALDSVTVDYPGAPSAVDNASLDIDAGSIVALLGPSGCGKTSLLRSIAGLERPVAGSVSIGGSVMSSASTWVKPERRSVGMVFQDGALFPHLTVNENIAFGLKATGDRTSRSERTARVEELLTLVDLDGLGDRLPDTLSGGQQQRVALARSLAPNPSVLLLDEPFSALDAGLRVQVRADVAKILREVGVTSIFVTHDQDEAFVLGDRVAVMRNGTIEQMASPDELYRSPTSRWVASFVGEANFVSGTPSDGGRQVATSLGSVSIDNADDIAGAGAVSVVIRPEQVEIAPGDDAEITAVEYYGHDVRYEVRLSDGSSISARTHPDRLLERGQRVDLALDTSTKATAFVTHADAP